MNQFAQLRGSAKEFEKREVQVLFVWPEKVAGNRQWLSGRDKWTDSIAEFFEEKETLSKRPYLRSLGSGPEETVCLVLADPSLTTSADFGVAMQGYHSACNAATTFIIDREGVVRWKLRDSAEVDRPSAELLLKTIDGFETPAGPAKEVPKNKPTQPAKAAPTDSPTSAQNVARDALDLAASAGKNGSGRPPADQLLQTIDDLGKKPPKPREDPLADVADIPAQELRAADDANKRYFLIGPKKNTKPPAEGYALLVIMPGGDGSADFHPFVKRIYKNALSDRYVAAQPIAVQWTPNQEIVWPTKTTPVAKMKFSTEEFVEAVIKDVAKKHQLDRTRVFTLSWSSSGSAAYATSLQNKRSVTGSFIAMSVFNPKFLPPLKEANGHAYYLYHSQQDRVCPYRMAEQGKNSLADNGAKVHLETYEGGHGWRGNVYNDIRQGIEWLEKNQKTARMP